MVSTRRLYSRSIGQGTEVGPPSERIEEAKKTLDQLSTLLRKHVPQIFAWGVSQREGKPIILVYAQRGSGRLFERHIPDELDGFGVYYVEDSQPRMA